MIPKGAKNGPQNSTDNLRFGNKNLTGRIISSCPTSGTINKPVVNDDFNMRTKNP